MEQQNHNNEGDGHGHEGGGPGGGGGDHGHDDHGHGPPRCVNVEGTMHPWNEPTITLEQIAQLGGFPASLGVLMIDQHNNERAIAPGQPIEVTPGESFCRRVTFRRGLARSERIDAEIDHLRRHHPAVARSGDWVLFPKEKIGGEWSPSVNDLVLLIPPGYPATPPYGLYVPTGLRRGGNLPGDYADTVGEPVPFPGSWGKLSVQINEQTWKPALTVTGGSNLRSVIVALLGRFAEGS
jgi:hypothetical protein